ncbi:tetratricopeptide repeat protein [Nocardiopsis lambiniae]|uniref:Tetratricopeptide repeat protein n=1 Tax=Nocardiopsis lambiniae TaxID=3075539 RepID=A0ABU2MBW9_9ACTN|nr:tetratricopeptide repeat protein [Nocardiopsis sp. DSM 44743]MDT0330057.1 tetratricopeptide repeat protein [Nocardiopsis sp. DSM 44743]
MTTTSGPSARSGPADPPPRATDPRDAPAGPTPSAEEASGLCDQARDLVANGHLDRAADLYRRAAAADAPAAVRARALLGLAVTEDGRGDTGAARDAARRAMEAGDPRRTPRAAHHLALSLEQGGEGAEAERIWRRLLDLGAGPGHTALAHHGLARAAEERGDATAAEAHWEAALSPPVGSAPADRLHAETLVEAARDLTGRLLRRGSPGAALSAADRGLSVADDPELRLLRAAAHLEHAMADLGAVVDPDAGGVEAEPVTAGAAVELLAGLLALRGDTDGSARVWRAGLEGHGEETAEEARARLRRGFATGEDSWWDAYLEEAVATASAPALAAELFAALTRMHALVSLPALEGESRPAVLREALVQAVRTPDELVWGPGLHADLRRRLAEATGGDDVLAEDWPDRL